MNVSIRAMSIRDYPAVVQLWQRSEGVGLNESDTEAAVGAFLRRNPDLSAVALDAADGVVGAVLCGHDGRRGYLHHLAVAASHRKRGIASSLVARCLDRLAAEGVPKCNIFLFADNDAGAAFWLHVGWTPRSDLRVLQKLVGPPAGPARG
jgi:ribosomal protein S18 acetylase RimI-like enzyme